MDIFKGKNLGIFAGGLLFGTAGIKLLTSKDAKKVYTSCTAAVDVYKRQPLICGN